MSYVQGGETIKWFLEEMNVHCWHHVWWEWIHVSLCCKFEANWCFLSQHILYTISVQPLQGQMIRPSYVWFCLSARHQIWCSVVSSPLCSLWFVIFYLFPFFYCFCILSPPPGWDCALAAGCKWTHLKPCGKSFNPSLINWWRNLWVICRHKHTECG